MKESTTYNKRMKQIFFIVFLNCGIMNIYAQSLKFYNTQGDQAFLKGDYQTARSWYNEGLDSCDRHSIQQLVKIWIDQPSMRESMRLPMRKCFNCMKTLAETGDSDAMSSLKDFYTEGIGVEKNSVLADYWYREWAKSMQTKIDMVPENIYSRIDSSAIKTPRKSLLSNRFYSFATYTWSPTMIYGFTAGIYFNKIGVYVSGRTDFKSVNAAFECNNTKVPAIANENPPYEFNRERWCSQMITGGLMYPIIKNRLFVSAGGGYGIRNYYREIVSTTTTTTTTIQKFSTGNTSEWCRNTEASYEGWTLEVGGMFVWKKLTVLGGVNSTRFKDLDVYFGIGIIF
jgi:hypothetical protein